MSSQSALTGRYTLLLFGAEASRTTVRRPRRGRRRLVALCWLCYRGIEVSARLQWVLLGIELAVLVVFSVVALYACTAAARAAGEPAAVELAVPNGMGAGGRVRHAAGRVHLLGLGQLALGERGVRRPAARPGPAAVLSTVLLVLNYLIVTVAALAFAGSARPASDWATPPTRRRAGRSGLGRVRRGLVRQDHGRPAHRVGADQRAATSQATIMPCRPHHAVHGTHGALPRSSPGAPPLPDADGATWTFGLVSSRCSCCCRC